MTKSRGPNIAIVVCFAAFLTVLSANQAHADVEYYTWGGFETVSQAFQRVALIFSSNGYKAFLAAITLMGLVMGGFSAYYKLATGQSRSALSWLIPIIFGAGVYAAFYVPKENVNVFDPVLNRTTTVASVPIGVSKSVWLVNLFERFLIKTLDDNPAHINEPTYGAVGIAGFEGATNLAHALEDSAGITQTFQTFMKDCAMFELTRPGSSLTWEALVKPPTGSTLLSLLAQAKNPAMSTMDYTTTSSGTPTTCDAAYDTINNYYSNTANSAAALGNACFGAGFVDTGQCQTNMASILSFVAGDMGVSTDPVLTSANMRAAQGVVDYLKTADATGATAASVGFADSSKSVGKGLLASFVNPKMINAYVAYAITLMPLMILFIATPLGRQAVGLCMSLVLWTMIIRGLDVMLFHMWAGELLGHVKSVGQIGNGVALKVSYADLFDSQLSSLADLRSSLFLLATAITGAMFKFGDSAMARLADKADMAHGAGYASGSGDRERQANARATENASAIYKPSSVMANMARGAAMNELASAGAGLGMAKAMGGPGGVMGGSEFNSQVDAAIKNASTPVLAGKENVVGSSEAQKRAGTAKGDVKQAAMLGSNVEEVAEGAALKSTSYTKKGSTVENRHGANQRTLSAGGAQAEFAGDKMLTASKTGISTQKEWVNTAANEVSAREGLSTAEGANLLLSDSDAFAKRFGVDKAYAETLKNAYQTELKRGMDKGTKVANNTDTSKSQTASMGVDGAVGLTSPAPQGGGASGGVTGKAGVNAQAVTKDGTSTAVHTSTSISEGDARTQAQARENALKMASSKVREHGSRKDASKSSSVGDTKAYDESSKLSRSESEKFSIDGETALVKWYMNQDKFKGNNTELERAEAALLDIKAHADDASWNAKLITDFQKSGGLRDAHVGGDFHGVDSAGKAPDKIAEVKDAVETRSAAVKEIVDDKTAKVEKDLNDNKLKDDPRRKLQGPDSSFEKRQQESAALQNGAHEEQKKLDIVDVGLDILKDPGGGNPTGPAALDGSLDSIKGSYNGGMSGTWEQDPPKQLMPGVFVEKPAHGTLSDFNYMSIGGTSAGNAEGFRPVANSVAGKPSVEPGGKNTPKPGQEPAKPRPR